MNITYWNTWVYKGNIPYDHTHMTFWRKQNYWWKIDQWLPASCLWREKELKRGHTRDYQAMKLFYSIQKWWINKTIHLSKLIEILLVLRVNLYICKFKNQLWYMRIQGRNAECNKKNLIILQMCNKTSHRRDGQKWTAREMSEDCRTKGRRKNV